MEEGNRDHLRRLDAQAYQGLAQVHWILTIDQRKQGWLTDRFYLAFRELLTHTLSRYQICSPVFCLMPDHLHLLWIGWSEGSDQRNAMKHLRQHTNRLLARTEHRLQKQAYDHVLREKERSPDALSTLVDYILANPERSELCQESADYPYTGCLIPGYPEVDILSEDFWHRFWRIYSALRERT